MGGATNKRKRKNDKGKSRRELRKEGRIAKKRAKREHQRRQQASRLPPRQMKSLTPAKKQKQNSLSKTQATTQTDEAIESSGDEMEWPEDQEIDYLERKLGLRGKTRKQVTKKLNNEYASIGLGEDFGDFLMSLDNVMVKDKEIGSKGLDESESFDDGEEELMSSESEESEEDMEVHEDMESNADEEEEEDEEEYPEDQEIDYLERKLGLQGSSSKEGWKKMKKEYASIGFDEGFADFLQGLDGSILRKNKKYRLKEGCDENNPEYEVVAAESDMEYSDETEDEYTDNEADKVSTDEENTKDGDTNYLPSQRTSDLYGREKTDNGGISAPKKYIPPHLRAKAAAEAREKADFTGAVAEERKASLAGLQRRVTGLLNRLAESNVDPISSQISSLYAIHSRRDTNEALTESILNSTLLNVSVNENQVHCNAALIAALHVRIGAEVGAYFLETTARRLTSLLSNVRKELLERAESRGNQNQFDKENGNKKILLITQQCSNILLLIISLYKFTIVTHKVIYGIANCLVTEFSESDVELLLLLLRHVGFQMRKDDPVSLVSLIRSVQTHASKKKSLWDVDAQQRCDFMLEMIYQVKNNRKRRQDEQLMERTKRLRRWIQRLKTGENATSHSELHISYEDLLNAGNAGRWWVVGSPWQQKQKKKKEESTKDLDKVSGTISGIDAAKEAKLMKLAKAQRMNTELRRKIFCVVMGSGDYLDAFERLLRLNLKPIQEREIVRVITHCCGASRRYNPFFALLAVRLCQHDHRTKFTFQLAFWDLFKLFALPARKQKEQQPPLSDRRLLNLAKLLSHLVRVYSLPISVLKSIDFTALGSGRQGPAMLFFLRAFFDQLFRTCDADTLRTVIRRIAAGKDVSLVTDSIVVFLKMHMKVDKSDSEVRLQMKIAKKCLEEVSVVDAAHR
eukprot:g6099.t1